MIEDTRQQAKRHDVALPRGVALTAPKSQAPNRSNGYRPSQGDPLSRDALLPNARRDVAVIDLRGALLAEGLRLVLLLSSLFLEGSPVAVRRLVKLDPLNTEWIDARGYRLSENSVVRPDLTRCRTLDLQWTRKIVLREPAPKEQRRRGRL